MTRQQVSAERIDWIDYAKGFCIVMVVLMHSTYGVEFATGQSSWAQTISDFARPFRMPDFFLISGLFLGRVIARDWKTFADRRVVHFVYFYVLWLTIQFAFKAPMLVREHGVAEVVRLYLLSHIEPFGTLWFIYLLPVFFALTKVLRRVPPLAVFLVAAGLEALHLDTGWTLIDEFAARYVYFFAGYWMAAHFFTLARFVQDRPAAASAMLAVWAVFNGVMVSVGLAALPGISLVMGFLGASAVIALSVLFSKLRLFDLLRYAGQNSLVIYLAFFLPMAATRVFLLKTGIVPDIGSVALIMTAVAVTTPLVLHYFVRGTWLGFLFERPAMFRLGARRPALAPAE